MSLLHHTRRMILAYIYIYIYSVINIQRKNDINICEFRFRNMLLHTSKLGNLIYIYNEHVIFPIQTQNPTKCKKNRNIY